MTEDPVVSNVERARRSVRRLHFSFSYGKANVETSKQYNADAVVE